MEGMLNPKRHPEGSNRRDQITPRARRAGGFGCPAGGHKPTMLTILLIVLILILLFGGGGFYYRGRRRRL
jgi:hypothetical protein